MYNRSFWVDEVTQYEGIFKETDLGEGLVKHEPEPGEIQVEGTPQDAAHWNRMEEGIFDAHSAVQLLLMLARQNEWEVEYGTVNLTNTLAFPFNNSVQSVSLSKVKEDTNYIILTEVQSFTGNVGEIVISDKLINGFKIAHTGGASAVTVKYIVIGGILK